VLDKLIERISGWRGRLLAYSSRLILIKSRLASIPVYLMSFFKFSKWAIKLIESQMAYCLWNDDSECHRYHLAGWQHINMEKDFGGLGVPNLRELNICLLASWVRRYFVDRDKIWKQVVDHKYNTASPNVFTCRDNGASNFWKGVLWAARVTKMGYRWRLGNGCKVRFWEDVWDGNSSLAIQFWEVYIIVNEQNKTVADLWDGKNLKYTFRRRVDVKLYRLWEEVVAIASSINFSAEEDEPVWTFQSNGVYSSHSLYRVINFRGVFPVYVSAVWKLIIPPRV
jgi:hypothetical protein